MSAQDEFSMLVPPRVARLLERAFQKVRRREGRHLTDAECLVRVARHFKDVHGRRMQEAKDATAAPPGGPGSRDRG